MADSVETTTNTGANAQTSAGDGKNTGAGATGADTQAASNTTGAGAGAAQTSASTTDAGGTSKADGALSQADIQSQIDAAVKKRLAEEKTRAQKQADEAAAMAAGEYQKLLATRDQDLAQAKQELQAARLHNQVIQHAHAAGVTNISVLMKLIKDDVEFDDNGQPQNVEKLVKAQIREIPGLVAAGADGAGAEGGGGTRKVEVPANNLAKSQGVQTNGPVSLYTPGLFKS